MSNPTVTIGDSIPMPSDPKVVRELYSLVEFDKWEFYGYALGEQPTFSPTGHGDDFIMQVPLDDALGNPTSGNQPDFISWEAWSDNVKKSPSVFVSAAFNSVMPKLLIPSAILVDNGWDTTAGKLKAYAMPGATNDLFNWKINLVNGGAIPAADFYRYVQTGAFRGAQYNVLKPKANDASATNTMVIELDQPTSPPTGMFDETTLVVGGAFCLLLNINPLRPGAADPQNVQGNPWTIKIEFGEVTMFLNSTGALKTVITGTGDDVEQTANMVEGKAKQGPPQQEYIVDKSPYVIMVYPVWNGLVVSSGVSDATASLQPTAQYIQKSRTASIKNTTGGWFNPQSPANVVVAADPSVLVDFGTKMTLTATECTLDFCYLPCFFSRQGWFDQFFVVNDDVSGDVTYTFKVFSIYTLNGTGYTVTETMTDTGVPGTTTGTHYMKDAWVLSSGSPKFTRFAPQIFGAVLQTKEEREFPIKNGNGNFSLTWSGGTAGDPSPSSNWVDYIQSISVTIGQDGSSGSITVDKYGIAGQDAIAVQKIGAITIDATGGFGTVAGSIFKGLAMGIAEQLSPDGATWTIPLVGLEKKLEDIALINVPFFDGYTVSKAVNFLCKYAGIFLDTSAAPNAPLVQLGISEDLNVPRFDWRSGMNVKTALDDVMQDTGFVYVVRNGTLYLYQQNTTTALPAFLGPDRNPGGATYPNTKVTIIDRSPDFDDLRNEIVAIAMDQVKEGQNTNFATMPLIPRMAVLSQVTTPDVPWAKSKVDPVPGFMTEAKMNTYVNNLALKSRMYSITGKTTIPGNASINVYDQWNGYGILSVTHNLDFQGKSWTTELELVWHG